MRKVILICVSLVLVLGTFPTSRKLKANEQHSKKDIAQKWWELMPKFSGDPYSDQPNATPPYKAGSLKTEFLQDGINTLNFVRFLAGIPSDVELKPELNNMAQHGAVVVAANKELSHNPPRPPEMSDEFFNLGSRSAGSSNLQSGFSNLSHGIIDGYIADDAPKSNLKTVGHRRWALNPSMKYTGFGFCEGYSAMQSFDKSRKEIFDYRNICWPAEGFFPLKFMGFYPWSVTLNPKRFEPFSTNISISFKHPDGTVEEILRDSDIEKDKYLIVNTVGYGVPYCIIFKSGYRCEWKPGSEYEITINGLVETESQETISLTYKVKLFAMETTLKLKVGSKLFQRYFDSAYSMDTTLDSEPVIVEGRTLLPIRAIVENLGGSVQWDNSEKKVTITLDDKQLEMWIGSKEAVLNSQTISSEVSPTIIAGRTMLPLRFVAQSLGCQVHWNENDKSITVIFNY